MNQETYRHLISGRSARLTGIPLRLALTALSWPYGLLVRLRNHCYARRWFRVHHADVPVLCVGNLTAGGTGKTPLVIWLARLLMQKELRVAILTRGYKAKSVVCASEPALSLPKGHPEETPHGVTPSGDEPAVVYRRDQTRLGWPLGAEVRELYASTTDRRK